MTQSEHPTVSGLAELREQIIANPGIVLDDSKVLQALASVENQKLGTNVIDGRGLAIRKLEERLISIEADNQALANILRENDDAMTEALQAALILIDTTSAARLRVVLASELPRLLRLGSIVLLLDGTVKHGFDRIQGGPVRSIKTAAARDDYLAPVQERPGKVLLRPVRTALPAVYGKGGPVIRSEAVLPFSHGEAGLVGVLVLGSEKPGHFQPNMSTTLLEFFRDVFTRKAIELAQ